MGVEPRGRRRGPDWYRHDKARERAAAHHEAATGPSFYIESANDVYQSGKRIQYITTDFKKHFPFHGIVQISNRQP
jgi:hypothetical protein